MLRRTKGRLLLTLLVVTGLAGTLNDSSLSKKERKTAITLMRESKTEVLKSIKGLSRHQFEFKSSPADKSIEDYIFQIAADEHRLWSILIETMKAPSNPEKRSEIEVTDEDLVEAIITGNYSGEMFEIPRVKKPDWKSVDQALSDFKNRRITHIRYINTSTEDLRNHVIHMPFGWIDCYQLSLAMAASNQKQIQQINKIKEDSGFPINN